MNRSPLRARARILLPGNSRRGLAPVKKEARSMVRSRSTQWIPRSRTKILVIDASAAVSRQIIRPFGRGALGLIPVNLLFPCKNVIQISGS